MIAISAAATLALGLAACNKPAEETAEPAAAVAEPATAEPAAAAPMAGDAVAAPAAGDAAAAPAADAKKATEDQQSSGGVNPE